MIMYMNMIIVTGQKLKIDLVWPYRGVKVSSPLNSGNSLVQKELEILVPMRGKKNVTRSND